MAFVKDFDHRLAFVSTSSLLSELDPQETLHENKYLSKLVAYVYMILSHYNEANMVDAVMYDAILKLFPFANLVSDTEAASGNVAYWKIKEVIVDSSKTSGKVYPCFSGDILMPPYLGATSTIVYNIYNTDSSVVSISSEYISLALNFFNVVVRSRVAGVSRIVWRNPVTMDSRLKDEKHGGYDYMFCLYVADKYIQAIDTNYTSESDDVRLAMSMAFVDYMSQLSATLGVPVIEKTIRDITQDDIKQLMVSSEDYTKHLKPGIVSLPVDIVKSNTVNTALILMLAGTKLKQVFVTGYKDYSHIAIIAKHMPNTKFSIWDTNAPQLSSTHTNVKRYATLLNNKQLLAGGAVDVLISGLLTSQALVKGFKGVAALRFGTALYKTKYLFPSLFTSSHKDGYAIVDTTKVISKTEFGLLKNAFTNRSIKLTTEYRDTNKYAYTLPDSEELLSYDEAVMQSVFVSLK